MRIVEKGETMSIQFAFAHDLINAGSALEDDQKGLNDKLIKAAKEAFAKETKEAAIREKIEEAKKAKKSKELVEAL